MLYGARAQPVASHGLSRVEGGCLGKREIELLLIGASLGGFLADLALQPVLDLQWAIMNR